MSRLISEESSCAKKLFLYGSLLSMLSHMNYVCIHSDNDADNTSQNNEQAYTGCLNDRSEYIDICTHTRSKSVQWSHRSQTDVSECWDKRQLIWEAVSSNSETTEIISHCFKSENIHNEMLLEQWRKATLLQKTVSVILRISLYRTDSVYTWLNNDWTLRKNVTDILSSQQFFWPEMLQNVCTFCWNCDKCCTNNSWKDC